MPNDDTSSKESLELAKEAFEIAFDNLNSKFRNLVIRNRELKEENLDILDSVKDLKSSITELKLQITKLNSTIVLKEKEISDLKGTMHKTKSDTGSGRDRDKVRSQLKEMISKIDIHLKGYEEPSGTN